MIDLNEHFNDILIELADSGADFVLIGGYAMAFHGHVRATKDLDVLVRATRENAAKVYSALAQFGAPMSSLKTSEGDLSEAGNVLQVGVPPNRIDILTAVSGITFDEAISGGRIFELDGRQIPVIDVNELIVNKRAAGREQDIADIKVLSQSVKDGE